jgi:hypothetical protein
MSADRVDHPQMEGTVMNSFKLQLGGYAKRTGRWRVPADLQAQTIHE